MKWFHTFKFLALLCLTLVTINLEGQYSIDKMVIDIQQNSSLSQLFDYIDKSEELAISNTNSRLYPQVNLVGQASYQSETSGLNLDFPGVNIPTLSKDQYKVQAEINQIIYDGGLTAVMKELKKENASLEKNGVNIELDMLVEQGINIFFSIKELEIRLQQINYKMQDITASVNKMQAAVVNGIILKSELGSLQAEQIKLQQQEQEVKSTIKAQRKVLSLLTDNQEPILEQLEVDENITYRLTANPATASLRQSMLQNRNLMLSQKIEDKILLPKLGGFGQFGYGKPGLNFLKNEFTPYYIVGLRVQWNVSGYYNAQKNKQINLINQNKVMVRKEAIETKLAIKDEQLKEQLANTEKYTESDKEILEIRKKIKEIATVQLENGAITTTEYLIKLNDENEAKLQSELHKLTSIKTKYLINHNFGAYTQGNN